MKTLLLTGSIMLIAFSFTACKLFSASKGDGEIVKTKFDISDYKKLTIVGNPQVIYEEKELPYLEIVIDENLLDLLNVNSANNSLNINHKKCFKATTFIIRTNSSNLEKVNAEGALEMKIAGKLQAESLSLALTGKGEIAGDSVYCQSITSKVSGKGRITIKGKTTETKNSIIGNGTIDQIEMQAKSASCKITGSGNIYVYATESLNVNITGSGNVTYKGNPKISQSITGSGKIINDNL